MLNLPPPTIYQLVSPTGVMSQPWADWLYRVSQVAGTVNSVGLSMPSGPFAVSGSPVTTTGTLAVTLNTQAVGTVWAGPVSGAAAAPTFRTLANTDLPSYLWTSNIIASTDTVVVPADKSMVVVDYLDVQGTLDNQGNIAIL